jgi:hypothetical protein
MVNHNVEFCFRCRPPLLGTLKANIHLNASFFTLLFLLFVYTLPWAEAETADDFAHWPPTYQQEAAQLRMRGRVPIYTR